MKTGPDTETANLGGAPEWFANAVRSPREHCTVDVEGCPIHYLRWGAAGNPGLLFVHGNRAHAYWYAHVAPHFANDFNVAAIDLSSMGDSGRRDAYSLEQWGRECTTVCEDAGFFDAAIKPVIVGHSIGGGVVLRAARELQDKLAGVILADAFRQPVTDDQVMGGFIRARAEPMKKRFYATREEALSRFSVQPPFKRPTENGYTVDYVAQHSVTEEADGWSWKFDVSAYAGLMQTDEMSQRCEILLGLKCRAAAIIAEYSHLLDEGTIPWLKREAGGRIAHLIVPDAHHHLMLDQPLAFITALQGILSVWLTKLRGHSP